MTKQVKPPKPLTQAEINIIERRLSIIRQHQAEITKEQQTVYEYCGLILAGRDLTSRTHQVDLSGAPDKWKIVKRGENKDASNS